MFCILLQDGYWCIIYSQIWPGHHLNFHINQSTSSLPKVLQRIAYTVAFLCKTRWASARNTPSSSWPSPLGCGRAWNPSSSWWAWFRMSRTSAVCPFPLSVPWSCRDWWDAASSRAPRRWGNNGGMVGVSEGIHGNDMEVHGITVHGSYMELHI